MERVNESEVQALIIKLKLLNQIPEKNLVERMFKELVDMETQIKDLKEHSHESSNRKTR